MSQPQTAAYTTDAIQVLKGLEGVRKRAGDVHR